MGILYSKGKSFTGSVCDTSLSTVSNHPIANSAVATAINQINSDLTELCELLWTNTSTAATFEAQTVALDLSSYDFVMIGFRSTIPSQIIRVGMGFDVTFSSISSSNAAYAYERNVNVTSTGIVFGTGYVHVAGSAKAVDNRLIQPSHIYGIKTVPRIS